MLYVTDFESAAVIITLYLKGIMSFAITLAEAVKPGYIRKIVVPVPTIAAPTNNV